MGTTITKRTSASPLQRHRPKTERKIVDIVCMLGYCSTRLNGSYQDYIFSYTTNEMKKKSGETKKRKGVSLIYIFRERSETEIVRHCRCFYCIKIISLLPERK